MDIRIVNTCNNDCLYCLEQSYRNKEKYIDKNIIFSEIFENNDNIVNFYGGNALLHPDILEIINYCKLKNKKSISLLTNTFGLNNELLEKLKLNGLNSLGFYFNSFDKKNHDIIVNGGINFTDLINNIKIIIDSGINYKAIIHINNQNISTLFKDIYILNKKFGVKNIEFINFFPFDRPYDKYKKILEYDIENNKNNIKKLFIIIKNNNINAKFIKFSKEFFGKFAEFYDFENGILKQIGDEDKNRLINEIPFCFIEKRCNNCFLKDYCKYYEKN